MNSAKIVVRRNADGSIEPLHLPTGVAHLVEIPSGVSVIHLRGPAFSIDKCFLLPAATKGIATLRTIFGESPGADVLVVGHTDASASAAHNRALSLARAQSIAAFLTDDVQAWLAYFSADPPGGDAWAVQEVIYMLSVLPVGEAPFFSEAVGSADAIRRFQEAIGMDPNGHTDEDMHRELIAQYMALDGTSLPSQTSITAHGCGEAHPRGGATEEDRRVEVFLFHPKIEPVPSSETSRDEYPEWIASATTVHEVELGVDPAEHLELRLHDDERSPMPQTPFRVTIGNAAPIVGISDDEGFVFIRLPAFCPEFIHVEWSEHPIFEFEHSLDVFPSCSSANPTSRALARLNNLGYAPTIDFEAAARAFQVDYRVDDNPIAGLDDGALPPATQAKLDSIWDDKQTDASLA